MDKNHILKKNIIEAWERYVNQSNTCDDLALILDSIINDDHIEEFNDVFNREVWDKTINELPPTSEEKEIYRKEFARLIAEYESKRTTRTIHISSRNKIVHFIKTWYASAAAVLLLGLLIPIAYLYMKPKTEQISVYYAEAITLRGEIKTIFLPDQTEVTLNAESHLKYPENFNERSVELTGEAIFNVTSDPTRPFTIKTENMNVSVVGTVFGVKEYADDLTALVSVASGKVEVDLPDEKIMLEQNQQFKIVKATGSFEKTISDSDNYLSWTGGTLYFYRTPIHEVVNVINRHFPQIDIVLAEGEYSYLLSGEYENIYTAEEILKSIVYVTGLKYQKTGVNKYTLFKN